MSKSSCPVCPGSSKQSPQYMDEMELLRSVVHHDAYFSETWCRCRRCGRGWKVTEDPGYHYPYQTWERSRDSDRPDDGPSDR